jgi:hypothetical protein
MGECDSDTSVRPKADMIVPAIITGRAPMLVKSRERNGAQAPIVT